MNEKKSPQEQQLFFIKLQTVMIAVILLLILIFVVFMVMKVGTVMAMAESIDAAQINEAVASLKTAADHLAQVDIASLNQGIQGISSAAGELGQLDFSQLSGFLDSLEELSTQIDSVSGVLKGLFGR